MKILDFIFLVLFEYFIRVDNAWRASSIQFM